MKHPLLTGTLCIIALILGIASGYETGKIEGVRSAAAECHRYGGFHYSGTEYRCRPTEQMTFNEWKEKYK
jgi:hypothetical protein